MFSVVGSKLLFVIFAASVLVRLKYVEYLVVFGCGFLVSVRHLAASVLVPPSVRSWCGVRGLLCGNPQRAAIRQRVAWGTFSSAATGGVP